MTQLAQNSADIDDHENDDDEDDTSAQAPKSVFPNWAKPPTLGELKQHLENARSIHTDHTSDVGRWLDNYNVKGNAAPKSDGSGSKVQPKLIRKQAEWRYPALSEPFLSSSKVYNVKPVTWEDTDSAKQNELVLNNQFNTKIDKVAFIDEYVRTAVDEGTVVVKVGWEFEETEVEEQRPVVQFQFDPTFGPVIQQVDVLKHTSPSQFATDVPDEVKQAYDMSVHNGRPFRPIVTGQETVMVKKTVRNQPTLEVCEYQNLVIDPTAKGKMKNAQFVIHSFESSLSDLKKDGRYQNLEQIQVTNNAPLNEIDHKSDTAVSGFQFNDKARAKIVVYEYWGFWDIDGTGIVKPIVAAWVGSVMIRMAENPYPDKALPFVLVPYLPKRKSNYGEPDGALLEDNQKIIGAVMRGMIDLMGKSANAQTGTRKDALDSANQRKFEQGRDYQFNPGVNPQEAVYMHKYPEIPQSAPLMVQMQNAEAESLTGVKSFSQGMTGNSLGDVAAGVRGTLDSASKRETAILRRLAKGMVEIGRKIIAMNAQFLSEEEVVRVTNAEFVKVRRDDLGGNFDLELSISTAEEDDNKAKELAFMLQTVGPNEDPSIRRTILAEIMRLRKMPDLAHKMDTYQPQPDPFQQQMQQLELAEKQATINLLNAQAAAAGSNAQLHTVKAGTESAKADHLRADTDQKNLNYVQDATGVNQERDLQKQREATAGQLALQGHQHAQDEAQAAADRHHEVGMKVLDSHLTPEKPATKK